VLTPCQDPAETVGWFWREAPVEILVKKKDDDALGGVDMTESWRQEKNVSAFFEMSHPEGKNGLENAEGHQTRSRRILRAFRPEIGEELIRVLRPTIRSLTEPEGFFDL
jgi:hypothetical protein